MEIFSSYLFLAAADASQILSQTNVFQFPLQQLNSEGASVAPISLHKQGCPWTRCTGLNLDSSGISPVRETPQPPCAICYCAGHWTGKFLTDSVILWYWAPLCSGTHLCPSAGHQLRLPASSTPSLMLSAHSPTFFLSFFYLSPPGAAKPACVYESSCSSWQGCLAAKVKIFTIPH